MKHHRWLFALFFGCIVVGEAACGSTPRGSGGSEDDDDEGAGGSTSSTTGSVDPSTSSSGAGGMSGVGGMSGPGGMSGAGGMSGPGGMSGEGGMSGTGGTGGMAGGPVPLGDVCATDITCGSGFCMRPSVDYPILGGGPANGYCTKACASDADCPGVGSTCLADQNGDGTCFLGCELGPALEFLDDPLDPSKCYGREDVACLPLTGGGDVCIPTCGSNSQCPAGRVCDPGSGTCVTSPSMGLPMGDACDPMAATPECAGVCLTFSNPDPTVTIAACSTRCVAGGQLDGADCGGLAGGLCIFLPSGAGAGDVGYCTETCDVHSDCLNPTFWCRAVGFTANKYCLNAAPCPNGQTDCTAANTTCTNTAYGPYCIDNTIPL
jgi:hypothetical protein